MLNPKNLKFAKTVVLLQKIKVLGAQMLEYKFISVIWFSFSVYETQGLYI